MAGTGALFARCEELAAGRRKGLSADLFLALLLAVFIAGVTTAKLSRYAAAGSPARLAGKTVKLDTKRGAHDGVVSRVVSPVAAPRAAALPRQGEWRLPRPVPVSCTIPAALPVSLSRAPPSPPSAA